MQGQVAHPLPPRRITTEEYKVVYLTMMANRKAKLHQLLTEINVSLDTQIFCHRLDRRNGKYCDFCSTNFEPAGTCGPTCALLCPPDKSGLVFTITSTWLMRARNMKREYNAIIDAMTEHRGRAVPLRTLKVWEAMAEKLRVEGLSCREKEAETGRIQFRVKEHEGFNPKWTFETAWGKGPDWSDADVRDDVAPDEMPCSPKRKLAATDVNFDDNVSRTRYIRIPVKPAQRYKGPPAWV